jgi:hypothetical protein
VSAQSDLRLVDTLNIPTAEEDIEEEWALSKPDVQPQEPESSSSSSSESTPLLGRSEKQPHVVRKAKAWTYAAIGAFEFTARVLLLVQTIEAREDIVVAILSIAVWVGVVS